MRKLFLIIITICGMTLTGCAQLIEINDQESDVIAEYMAGTMLRHDNNYGEALIYPETTTETTETSDMTESGEMAESDNTPVTSDAASDAAGENATAGIPDTADLLADKQNGSVISLASLFKDIFKDKFSIMFSNYKLYDSYPEEYDFFTIETKKDYKILAVTFNLKNTSTKPRKIDLKNENIIYQLTDKTDRVYNPMMTLLNNDIQYINLEVAAGKTQQAVILFEVPKDIDMSTVKLTITSEDKTTVMGLNE